jgi:HAE1 family hydrophobic/amphiphilic exporter-1
MLAIQRQPGRNTVDIADAVKNLLPKFREQLPAAVDMFVLLDRSTSIRESVRDVETSLALTLVLVVLVIFVFLRNLSATVIPSLALPLSLIGSFAVMYLLDYSLDNLSLMALTLAVGFVVDDAIVMLENIVRHMEMGKNRLQAAIDGSREIGFTIVSMTLSLAAVFIPVLFMGGIVGRIFREFAVTIGAAVLFSGFVSLTLTPMLAARFLRPPSTLHHGRVYGWTERGFAAMLRFYDRTLWWVIRHRRVAMVFSLVVLIASVWLFIAIPKGFLPSEDREMFFGQTEAVEGTSYVSMFAHQQALAGVIQQDPDVEAFVASAGAGGGRGSANTGRVFARLKPRATRRVTADQIIDRLRGQLAAVTGVRAYLQNPAAISVGGQMTKSQYQYTLQGPDTAELYRYAGLLMERIRELPGFLDVTTDVQLKNPQINVGLNRDRAATLGVSAEQIELALFNAYGSRQISTIFAPNNQYQVVLEMLPEYQRHPAALALLRVRSASGALVPLNALVNAGESVGPLTINHLGQLPAVTVSFNLQAGLSLGAAVARVNEAARAVIPATISTSFQGTAQAFQSSMRGMGLLLLLAVLVIYMVLAILYENFFHPVTILSALPFAGVGALLALLLFRAELSIYGFVGIIMLVGLVKKNGIMMIDFAIEARRQQQRPPPEAIHQACMIRFRPIMMTTLAALMAGLPIAVGWGAGGEARRPLGLAVVGGLLFSQTLTLYVTPVFYIYFEKAQTWLRGTMGIRSSAPAAAT